MFFFTISCIKINLVSVKKLYFRSERIRCRAEAAVLHKSDYSVTECKRWDKRNIIYCMFARYFASNVQGYSHTFPFETKGYIN